MKGLLCSLLAMAMTGVVAASDPVVPKGGWTPEPFEAPPEAVLAAAEKVTPEEGADLQVFLRELELSYDEDGRETSTWTLVYRTVTRSGAEAWGTTERLWEPWHEERPVPRVRVIAPDGTAHELDPGTITESPAADGAEGVFDDRRVLHGPIPALEPGSIVEERWVVHESSPKFPEGVVRFFYPGSSLPVQEAKLVVEVPEGSPLRYVVERLDGVEPEEVRKNGRRRIVFRVTGLEAVDDVPAGLPPEEPREPRIGISTVRSWQDVARAYEAMVERRVKGAELPELNERVRRLVRDGQDPAEAVILVVRERVRYTGLEFGEAQIVPYSPEEVASRGYGDCKDKAVLAVALMRQQGIQARVALVDAGFGRGVDPRLPGLGAFDHAIVYVPGEPARWFDPTATFGPVGCLPLSDRGRMALVVDGSTRELVETPPPVSTDEVTIQERRIELQPFGKARLELEVRGRCLEDGLLRSRYAGETKDDVRSSLEKWAADELLADSIDTITYTDPEDWGTPFVVRLKMESGRGRTGLSDAVAAIRYESLLESLPSAIRKPKEDAPSREGRDFVFWTPYRIEWHYTIVPPQGFVLYQTPEDRTFAVGAGSLTERYHSEDGGIVHATLVFDSGPRRITAEQLGAARKAVEEIGSWRPAMIVYHHAGMRALAEGHLKDALRRLREEASAEPKEAIHLVRLARGLLAAGFGDQAKATARRAVALVPTSAVAAATLAWCLQHDDIGRRFGPGWDRSAALAAYEKATVLPEADDEVKLDHAILLEFGEDGSRYTTGEDLEQAVAIYRKVLKEHPNTAFEHNMLLDLLHLGRVKEILEHKDELGTSKDIDAVLAAAVAIEEGPEAASRMIAGRAGSAEDRSGIYTQAALLLLSDRRYAEAGELLRGAAQGSDSAASILAQAQLIGSTRRYEELDTSPATPQGLARALMVALVDPNPGDAMEKLISRRTQEVESEDGGEDDGTSVVEAVVHQMRRQTGLAPKVLVDLALNSMDIKVAGEAGPVRRIKETSSFGSNEAGVTFWAIQEDGEWRILSLGDELWPLGDVALDELDRGNLAGAGEVLDWARERSSLPDSPDSYAGSAFARMWRRGDRPGEAGMRRAAAALLTQSKYPKRGVRVLRTELEHDSEAEEAAWERIALAEGLITLERYDEAVKLLEALRTEHPDSDALFSRWARAMENLQRWDELAATAADRLEKAPDDRARAMCYRLLSRVAMRTGRFDEADHWLEKLLASDGAGSSAYNNRAWLALFRGTADQEALQWAFQAVQTGTDHGTLHTLACLLAEMDRPADAYKVIVQAIESSLKRTPRSLDWYVFGRMAECYGFLDAARSYYQRVEPPESGGRPTSTYALAQRRLRTLGRSASAQESAAGDPSRKAAAAGS